MAEQSNIEWTDSTFNPWIGCQKVGSGCDHCYAERSTPSRTLGIVWGPSAERHRTSPANWRQPRIWNDHADAFELAHGRRRRVFCASLADVFDNAVPQEWRDDLYELIYSTPNLDWLLLTKRIGNVKNMLPARGRFPSNVWLGATVVNQAEADRDIPKLLAVPARVRWLSIEPMLGPIDLTRIELHRGPLSPSDEMPAEWRGVKEIRLLLNALTGCKSMGLPSLDWIVAGGESGAGARPAHPDWFRSLRDQCAATGIAFHFKQWGQWRPMRFEEIPKHGGMTVRLVSDGSRPEIGSNCYHPGHCLEAMLTEPAYGWQIPVIATGKKAAGRLLDGVLHDEYPEARA